MDSPDASVAVDGLTAAVIINVVIAQKKYTNAVGLLAVVPLALQFFTGLYVFVLPYASKWRSARRNQLNGQSAIGGAYRLRAAHLD
jgi:hypothetical protein